MSKENKRKLVYKSSVIEIISQFFTAVIALLLRSAFVKYLGIDYVGLNVVIEDILSMLSLAELGFQSAIIYRLYKPIANDDYQQINSILSVLKKVYIIIGTVIIAGGMSLLPFLKGIINNVNVSWNIIYTAFILNLIATASTYYLGYKRTFLYANQRQYFITIVDTISNIGCSLLKVLIIILTNNYILAISLNLVRNVLVNLILDKYANNKYPLHINTKEKVDKQLTKGIVRDSKDVLAIKLAIFCYSSIDSLVISRFIGTNTVGYVSNYLTITNNISNISAKLFASLAPIVSLYLVENSLEDSYRLLNNYTFVRYAIALILFIPTFILSNEFISIWIGEQFIIPNSALLLFVILLDKYISMVHGPIVEFDEGLGYFKDIKYVLFIGSIAKLIVSIVGSNVIGVIGVYLGTAIAQVIFWIGRAKILFTNFFDNHLKKKYWYKQLIYILNIIVTFFACNIVYNLLNLNHSMFSFIVNGFLCVFICFIDIVIVFHKTDEFHYFLEIALSFVEKVSSRFNR